MKDQLFITISIAISCFTTIILGLLWGYGIADVPDWIIYASLALSLLCLINGANNYKTERWESNNN